jgi:hypothetical protein
MENRVMQDSGGKKPEEGKCVAPSKTPSPWWCPRGITKTQKCRLQKMRQRELAKKKEEKERGYWFNRLRPMTKPKQMWRKKRLAKEEGGSSGEEASKVTPARGEDNPGSGDGNPELGNCNPELGNCHLKSGDWNPESGNYHPESGNHNSDSGNSNPGKGNDWQGEEPVPMDVNMVFTKPARIRVRVSDTIRIGYADMLFPKKHQYGDTDTIFLIKIKA